MTGQTIAQLKASSPDSLWTFLLQIPGSITAQIFYCVLIFGVVGMLGSYILKWANDQVGESIIEYFFRSHIRRTVATVCTYLGTMSAGIGANVFFTADDTFVGWFNVIWLSLTTAFGADMGLNKGAKAVWTDEQRATAAATARTAPPATIPPQPNGDTK